MSAGGWPPDWNAIVAHACQSLGWDWETARRQLNIPRLRALNKYWQTAPPVHLSVAAYLGIKAKGGASPEQQVQPLPPAQTAGAILDDLLSSPLPSPASGEGA